MGMSELIEIREQLRETEAIASEIARAIADHPERRSLIISAKSIERRRQELESAFFNQAEQSGIDVCSYRLFHAKNGNPPGVFALGSVLGHFQKLFTLAFDAVRNGPKTRGAYSEEIAVLTALQFGYSFSGSLGVVLTVPRERQLRLFETKDATESARAIGELLRCDSAKAVRQASAHLGPAVVRAAYRLAEDHVQFDLVGDIKWRHGFSVDEPTFIQPQDMERLRNAINETSDETISIETMTGQLVGINVKRNTFDMEMDSGENIRGNFANAIDELHTVELPRRYKATIERRSVVRYSTEVEEPEFFLVDLEGPLS